MIKNGYQGDYLISVAKKLKEIKSDQFYKDKGIISNLLNSNRELDDETFTDLLIDTIKTELVWSKLVRKVEIALSRGKEVILMGDFNRPLQLPTPSYGTKLLLDWEKTGQVTILNKKHVHTRIDPATKKGSTLDLGVISINLKPHVTGFKVDTNREWTPYAMSKRTKRVAKRFSDHLGVKMSVRMKKVPDEWKANKEIINFRNTEGWELYRTAKDKAVDEIAEIANNRDLTIDEVRERIRSIDKRLQRESFGTTWIKPRRTTGGKPKPKRDADELFKEHLNELLKRTDTGAGADINRKFWKLKEKVVVPKVGPAEPSCINDPNTGELITNKEQIKSTSLAHCVKILTKNQIRECDKEELERKEENHRKIMEKKKNDNGEYILERKLYKMVLKEI